MASYVLELPVGRGKRYASGVSGVSDKLVSGWAVNGIINFQSGYPLALRAQASTLSKTFGAGQIRPSRISGCNPVIEGSAQSRLGEWFETSCFTQPGDFSLADTGRTDPGLRTQGANNCDFAVTKATAITEEVKVQFKAEFYNLFNRAQFRINNTTLFQGNAPTVTEQNNQPRLVQLGLKLSF